MTAPATSKYQKKILTLPNLLSCFRLCLIPAMIWTCCFEHDAVSTASLLLLSGATDVADGIIARKYGMVSDLGKALDPIADKLTQIAMLFCLVSRFPRMLLPLIVLSVKEVFAGVTGLLTIHKTGTVPSAVWHGKAATALLYTTMLIHLIWFNLPLPVSDVLIVLCTAMMLLSAVLYGIKNFKAIKESACAK